MAIALQTAGVALQAAGLLVLYLHWRARRRREGMGLLLGWVLVALGGVPWLLGVSPERGLALAALAPMTAGLLLIAPDGLPRVRSSAAQSRRGARERAAIADADAPSNGRLSRNIARWTGCLLAAPAFALGVAAAWQGFAPGSAIDRIAFSIFALLLAFTAAALCVLATMRPWRATLALLLAASVVGASAFLFVQAGGA